MKLLKLVVICVAIGLLAIAAGTVSFFYVVSHTKPVYTYSDFLNGYYIVPQSCMAKYPVDVAPEVAERPGFRARFYVTPEGIGGIMTEMPADCLLEQYDAKTLEERSQQGDPVAQFLQAYANAKADRTVCKRLETNRNLLLGAVKAQIPVQGLLRKKARRIPEAYAALEGIEEICRNNENHRYNTLMSKEDYYPIDARPE